MRIAIFSFYNGEINRGVEVWVRELSHELKKLGHEITVYSNGEDENRDYKNYSSNYKIDWENKTESKLLKRVYWDYWSRLITKSTLRLLRKYFKHEYDVVIPTNGGWQVAILRLASLIKNEKMVVVGHAGRGWDELNNLWAFPDLFVGLSEGAESWAKKVMPLVSAQAISNGINLENFSLEGKKAKLNMERPVILGVGAFSEGKRQELLIEAVSKLDKGSLLLVGDGERKNIINNFGKEKLGKRFRIKKVNHNIISEYYRAADVFSLPVWEREAFGLVFLEAMACGLPVVTSSDPVRAEIVGDAGLLVDVEDPEKYAKALEKAAEIKWGGKPRKQAEKFSWKIIAREYDRLLGDLVVYRSIK